MSPTSYQLLHPAMYFFSLLFLSSGIESLSASGGYEPDERTFIRLRWKLLHPAIYFFSLLFLSSGIESLSFMAKITRQRQSDHKYRDYNSNFQMKFILIGSSDRSQDFR